ncbi:MFS transporter [Paraburkholderia sp.]|uniref:MFS transporter n=1 Tax=Paraburkholderia sp. TaxID=1926495 RepID=UPI0023A5EBD8|nr:MFS transporter [Paraburkholderia sp.]MDE1180940.1 MFS transporter [Paraburkholderia sp.]
MSNPPSSVPVPSHVTPEHQTAHPLSSRLLFILSACAGASVANLYYAQPLLALIARAFGDPDHVGWIAVATQLGYTVGIVFILPLGDLVDRRKLTVALAAALAIATFSCALSPSLIAMAVASLFVGFAAVTTQIMIPIAADLAPDHARGRAVGVVFSGILAGILLARTVSGAIGQLWGWRVMFFSASVTAIVVGATLWAALPALGRKTSQSYLALLGSMGGLLMKHRPLRAACAIQACVFAIFSAFWSVLALLLAQPPFGMGSAVAGAFGIVGLVGIGAANLGGRAIDRYGRRAGVYVGLACCVAAFVIFEADVSLRGLIAGVLLLDFGMSMANVSNQSMILGLDAQARSRINTLYVTAIFLGGALGSAAASIAWARGGWHAVCAFGLAVALLGLAIHAYTSRGNAIRT